MAPRPETHKMNGSTGHLTRTPVSGCSEKVVVDGAAIPNGSSACIKDTPKKNCPHEEMVEENALIPDGGWGWAVLFGTVLVNVVVIGHAKSFGVYFKNLMEEFDSTPSKVALLQAINISMFSFLSPLASILSQSIGPRKVALFGGITACIGLMISAFTPNMSVLYLSYGLIQGISLTFTFTPGITMIAKYFHKRRGLANGIAIAGNALGGMLIPLVVDRLITTYGLRGCFLIMGGILLHACVGAMFWQPVEMHQKKSKKTVVPVCSVSVQPSPPTKLYDEVKTSSRCDYGASYLKADTCDISDDSPTSMDYLVADCHKPSSSEPDMSSRTSIDVEDLISGFSSNERNLSSFLDCKTNCSVSPFHQQGCYSNGVIQRNSSSPHLGEHLKQVVDRTYGSSNSTESLPIMHNKLASRILHMKSASRTSSFIYLSSYNLGPSAGALLTKEHFTEINGDTVYLRLPKSPASDAVSRHFVSSANGDPKKKQRNRWKWILSHFDQIKVDKTIFEKSRFYVMTVSLFFHVLGYPGTLMFLPLQATNLGFSQARAASLLSVLALSDLIGRVCCAWLSDFHLCPRKYWFIGGMLMSGLISFTLPLYQSYAILLVGTAGFGFCCGAYIGLVVVMFADVYGPEKVALAYSISTVTGGFMALGGPPFMGYVLEVTDSYVICQSILGTAQLAGAAIWVIEPWAVRYEKKRASQKKKSSPEEEQLV